MKIKNLEPGCIIWYKNSVLGITGLTLPQEFYDFDCEKITGNPVDYEIKAKKTKEGWIKL